MKKLEELGISPAPWESEVNEDEQLMIYDSRGHDMAQSFGCDADANIMKSAPELYEALRKITEEQECGRDCAKCKNHGCVIKECKAALHKASGESEVRK